MKSLPPPTIRIDSLQAIVLGMVNSWFRYSIPDVSHQMQALCILPLLNMITLEVTLAGVQLQSAEIRWPKATPTYLRQPPISPQDDKRLQSLWTT